MGYDIWQDITPLLHNICASEREIQSEKGYKNH